MTRSESYQPPVMDTLHIPKGIRFQCSGCGNCCLRWPVPLTQQDADTLRSLTGDTPHSTVQISALERELRDKLGKPSGPGFRSLHPGDERFRGFSYTLEKRADGLCRFLTADNRCSIQQEHGAEYKPSMCRLFPHAFSETPSGIFAYVSFASSAVLFNQGMLLADQADLLAEKYQLYRHLFPRINPDWTQLQILDGHPLSWDAYLAIEERLLSVFEGQQSKDIFEKLAHLSRIVLAELPARADAEKLPDMDTPAHIVDQILLKYLYAAYLPEDVFAEESFDLDIQALMSDIVQAPHTVSLAGTPLSRLSALPLGSLDESSQDLLSRFIYCRLFAKLYFGPSLGHFSLLAGIHHLFYIASVACLHLKRLKLAGQTADFLALAETVRTIERRLSQMSYSSKTSAVLEVLLSSPSRLERVRQLLS